METEKIIRFTDLVDVPDCLNHEGHTLVVNEDCTGLILGRTIKTEHVKAEGNVLCCSLNVNGDAQVNGNISVKKIDSESISCSTQVNCSKVVCSEITSDQSKSNSATITNLQSQNVQAVSLGAKSVVADDVSVDTLRINKSIVLPIDTIAVDLHSKTLSVEDKASVNEFVSLVGSIDTLSSQNLLVNTLKGGTGSFDSIVGANLDMDLVVGEKIYIRTSQKEGCKELPVVKDVLEGTLLPQVSSKYVWFGKLKSPLSVLKFKVKSVMDVLGDYVPVVNFHTYETPVRLPENFKVDLLVGPAETGDCFYVNINFGVNMPATTKFVLSVVLQRI